MESIKLSSGKGRAKVVGTLICIGGSLVFTFWKGEPVWKVRARAPLLRLSGNGASGPRHEQWLEGSLLILLSCVCWSMWLILQAAMYKIYPARISLNVLINLFAVLQSSVVALLWGRNNLAIWRIGWDVQLLAILYCGVMVSGLTYYLQTWCISKNGPVFASMFGPLQLLLVGLFSGFAFGEQLHLGSLVGAVFIIIGMYCVIWGKKIEEPQISSKAHIDEDGSKVIDIPMASHGNDHA